MYGAIVLKGKTYIYNYVTTECQNPIGYFGDYDRIHKIAERYSCSYECPCNADKTLWSTDIQAVMVTSNASTAGTSLSSCTPY